MTSNQNGNRATLLQGISAMIVQNVCQIGPKTVIFNGKWRERQQRYHFHNSRDYLAILPDLNGNITFRNEILVGLLQV